MPTAHLPILFRKSGELAGTFPARCQAQLCRCVPALVLGLFNFFFAFLCLEVDSAFDVKLICIPP